LLLSFGVAAGWSAGLRPAGVGRLALTRRPAPRAVAAFAKAGPTDPEDDSDWESATWEVALRFADDERDPWAGYPEIAADAAEGSLATEEGALAAAVEALAAETAAPATVEEKEEQTAAATEPAAAKELAVDEGEQDMEELQGSGEWVEPRGTLEEEADESVAQSVVEFLPTLLERKYGANWEELLEDAEEEGGKPSDFSPGSIEEFVGFDEYELRTMVKNAQAALEVTQRGAAIRPPPAPCWTPQAAAVVTMHARCFCTHPTPLTTACCTPQAGGEAVVTTHARCFCTHPTPLTTACCTPQAGGEAVVTAHARCFCTHPTPLTTAYFTPQAGGEDLNPNGMDLEEAIAAAELAGEDGADSPIAEAAAAAVARAPALRPKAGVARKVKGGSSDSAVELSAMLQVGKETQTPVSSVNSPVSAVTTGCFSPQIPSARRREEWIG